MNIIRTRFLEATSLPSVSTSKSINEYDLVNHDKFNNHIVNFPGRNLSQGITRLPLLGRINLLIWIFMS